MYRSGRYLNDAEINEKINDIKDDLKEMLEHSAFLKQMRGYFDELDEFPEKQYINKLEEDLFDLTNTAKSALKKVQDLKKLYR